MRRSYIVYAVAIVLAIALRAPAQTPRPTPQRAAAAPPQGEDVQLPPGNVEHGRYIAERVAMCVECHSGRDSAGRILDSERYDGAPLPFVPPSPDWATRVPRNRGLPGYTDAMALRLLTQGAIGRDGRQLKPPMPRFHMTTQDAADVIAYLRSLR
jgi:mono/diheme cytochrome c family protein